MNKITIKSNNYELSLGFWNHFDFEHYENILFARKIRGMSNEGVRQLKLISLNKFKNN